MLVYLLLFFLFRLVFLIVKLGLFEVVLAKLQLLLIAECIIVTICIKQRVLSDPSAYQNMLCLLKLVVSLLNISAMITRSGLTIAESSFLVSYYYFILPF